MRKAAFVLLMVLVSIGCLEKDVTHTLYIEDDGSVTWEVLETNVYSSAGSPEERLREEAAYLADAMAGRPSIVRDLDEIGGMDAHAELLRDSRPFSLRAIAYFKDPDHSLSGLLGTVLGNAEVALETAGHRNILRITILDDGRDPEDLDAESPTEFLRAEELRLVLATGEFEEGVGFRIEENGRVAILTGETDGETDEPERWQLVWSDRD